MLHSFELYTSTIANGTYDAQSTKLYITYIG